MQKIEAPNPLLPRIYVLLMCAGEGHRMQSTLNKPFLKLGEFPLFLWSLKTFLSSLESLQILLVHRSQDLEMLQTILYSTVSVLERKKIHLVEGGTTRNQSVFHALQKLHHLKEPTKKPTDFWVLIHDGARPFLLRRDLYKILYALQTHPAVTLGYSISDTIKHFQDGKLKENLNRNSLRGILTPQGFHFSLIWNAYQNFNLESYSSTDDTEIALQNGHSIHFIEGEKTNFKITTQKDLKFAQTLVSTMRELLIQ